MTRLAALLALMLSAATFAHAENSPPAVPSDAAKAAPPPVAAKAGEVPVAAPAPDATKTPPAVAATKEEPQTRQEMMRELQEQGREAALKARELQATDPAAARKVMQDYYDMRQQKMLEMRDSARQQAAERRAERYGDRDSDKDGDDDKAAAPPQSAEDKTGRTPEQSRRLRDARENRLERKKRKEMEAQQQQQQAAPAP